MSEARATSEEAPPTADSTVPPDGVSETISLPDDQVDAALDAIDDATHERIESPTVDVATPFSTLGSPSSASAGSFRDALSKIRLSRASTDGFSRPNLSSSIVPPPMSLSSPDASGAGDATPAPGTQQPFVVRPPDVNDLRGETPQN